jgi:hypothetical protein
MKSQDQVALLMYVRAREDFQDMRKRMDNRLGRKADGSAQALKEERYFALEDVENFDAIAMEARHNEKQVEKMLGKTLVRFPIWTEWLSKVKGVGEIAGAWIIGSIDIGEAGTVSKIWQYAGLNPGLVRGKKRVPVKEYKPEMGEIVTVIKQDGKDKDYIVMTNDLVKGDRPTSGFILPYNKRLRVALAGVLASGFIKAKSDYALNFYYPMKARLEQEVNPVDSVGTRDDGKPWETVSKGHRDMAAKRYMLKMFLRDLYVAWRTLEGLPVRAPYQEEYLGRAHQNIAPVPPIGDPDHAPAPLMV